MLHARRATSAYQLAVRPGSEGEFMGACCSLIRIVGDEEPGLFSGLVGSRAWLDKALRRMDQGPEGAAVVAVRLAQMGPGAIHHLMGATSNKRLDELLKVARGVWLCDMATSLTEAAAESGEALGAWAKRNASDIRGVARQVGWSTPADAGGIGEAAGDRTEASDGASRVDTARRLGRALNDAVTKWPYVEETTPALISKDGLVIVKKYRVSEPQFRDSRPDLHWSAMKTSALVNTLRFMIDHGITGTKAERSVSLDGAWITIRITLKPAADSPPPPREEARKESAPGRQMVVARKVADDLDNFIRTFRTNAKTVEAAVISPSGTMVQKTYTVAQPGREIKSAEDLLRYRTFSRPEIIGKNVTKSGKSVIIRIYLAKLE